MLTTEQENEHLKHLGDAMDNAIEELELVPVSFDQEIPKPELITRKCLPVPEIGD